ncbi:Auxilin-related protein 1 [Acorus calamus]|uniref:Auxilin-related protein 1 n=1 Tax=Acorus calamus TaxID=4465 RepID=A0AAV9DPD8_ACOCL|nr:Auxilin-related protein 1 [Acorus calamus]
MDDFPDLLGLRPQGKAAPMKPRSASSFDGVFGGPPPPSFASAPSYDSIFRDPLPKKQPQQQQLYDDPPPVYDKPVYDDDIFEGVPGLRSSSAPVGGANHEDDIFGSLGAKAPSATVPPPPPPAAPSYDDLLGGFGRAADPEPTRGGRSATLDDVSGGGGSLDDLIPGFGWSRSTPPLKRETSDANHFKASSTSSTTSAPNIIEEPFVVLESSSAPQSPPELFADPWEHISVAGSSKSTKIDDSSVSGGVFADGTASDGLANSVPLFTTEIKNETKDKSYLRGGQNTSPANPAAGKEPLERSSAKFVDKSIPNTAPVDNYRESHQTLFDMPTGPSNSYKSAVRSSIRPSETSFNHHETNTHVDMSPKSDENLETNEDIWLSVSEIPLFTQLTSAPPPSRPPPPLVIKQASSFKRDKSSYAGLNAKKKINEFASSLHSTESQQFSKPVSDSVKTSGVSSIDELEDFAMGNSRSYADENTDFRANFDELDGNAAAAASAAAMKEAMDKAEAKFKHAREVRERERDARAAKSGELSHQEKDEKASNDAQEREYKERQEKLEREREQREREEKEIERKRLERERERQAVERATREARERAATEARLRAEKQAVERANAAARERAERAAVQRAQAEARERAAAEAREKAEREKAEKATSEARERATREKAEQERAAVHRAQTDARQRAERAAYERAVAEARERAAAEARGRAAAAEARVRPQKNVNDDIESFFNGMGARANSAPKQRSTTLDPTFGAQVNNRTGPDGAHRTSSGNSSSMRKASSTTSVDEFASLFGGAPSSGEFQEIDGEPEERRRARLERHQRTQERAAKALAEKNERDLQTQRDQAERHRIGETVDGDIKRWAAGKEGNLRALLSTLQYVLWPECGWQPVSLTDLITAASVKKVYRKATLCIHPDKVQQKGANLHQKYIAEKVFDLLKEAWNKFNSEELF